MNEKETKNKIMRLVVIVGIIIIPLIYSFFYLKAFWDPYGNLENIPVAIVNLDKGDNESNKGKEIADKLLEQAILDFNVVDKIKADDGLKNKEYYAVITIPENFTENLNTADTNNKQSSIITYMPNQKSNYLASQIINKVVVAVESEIKQEVAETVVENLSDKLKEVPEQVDKLNDGINQIGDGVNILGDGLNQLNKGTDELENKYNEFNTGLTTLQNGASLLAKSTNELASGTGELLKGVNTLKDKTGSLNDLSSSINLLSTNSNKLENNISNYIDGSSVALDNSIKILTNLVAYIDANPQLLNDNNIKVLYQSSKALVENDQIKNISQNGAILKQGVSTFNNGMKLLNESSSGLVQINPSINLIAENLTRISSGTNELNKGVKDLDSGVTVLANNSQKILGALNTLSNGSSAAVNGVSELSDGIQTASDEISNSKREAENELSKLDGLSNFTGSPVEVEEQDYGKVDEYGTGFAPYFMSLSLWVGGLVIFMAIYYDYDKRFKLLGKESENRLLRSFAYISIGAIQAVILAFFLKLGLGYEVTNNWLYYGSCILVSTVFISIIQFLMVNFKDLGKFLSILFLILQLSASGGTFPIETEPVFFRVMYNFMPMKYSVNLIKESLISIDQGFAMHNILILLGMLFVVMILTVIFDILKRKKNNKLAISSKYLKEAKAN